MRVIGHVPQGQGVQGRERLESARGDRDAPCNLDTAKPSTIHISNPTNTQGSPGSLSLIPMARMLTALALTTSEADNSLSLTSTVARNVNHVKGDHALGDFHLLAVKLPPNTNGYKPF